MKKVIIVSQKKSINQTKFNEAESYLLRIHEDIADIRHGFIRLGFHLDEIKKCLYHEAAGYADFYEFCEVNYGLEATTVKRYIEVWRAFAEYDDKSHSRKMWIDEKYAAYSYSQLVEMLPLDEKQRKQILPVMTIKEIRQKKKEMKNKKCDVAPQSKLIESPAETEEQPEVVKCDVAPPEYVCDIFKSMGLEENLMNHIFNIYILSDSEYKKTIFQLLSRLQYHMTNEDMNNAYMICRNLLFCLMIAKGW